MAEQRAGKGNRATVIAAVVVAVVLVAVFAGVHLARGSAQGELVAVVHDGDGAVHELPLSQDAELVAETSFGSNTVVVRDGAVSISDADCPHGDCMRQKAASAPGEQVICLPHELWIEVRAADSDGASALDTAQVGWASGDGPTADVDTVAR